MTTVTTHPAELNSGVWTSWLPLTTAWTSQAACNSAAWARFGIQFTDDAWPYIYDPAYGQSVANTLTCLPPQATEWWEGASTVSSTITSWSIGPIVCPGAYTTFSTISVDDTSTSVICCPTSFDFARNLPQNTGIDGVCTSIMTSGEILTYASPLSNSYPLATTTLTTSALLIAVPVEGYNFAAATTSSSTSSNTASITPAGQSTTTSIGPTNTSTQKSGLSTGAEAGIGVGAAVVVILVALGAFLFFRRRRRYEAAPTELPGGGENGNGQYKPGTLVEAFAPEKQPRAEVDGASRPAELQG